MTLLLHSAETGVADGTLVDGTNSAIGGDAFTHVSNTADITYQSGASYKGARGFRHAATSTASYIGWTNVSGGTNSAALRMYFRMATLPGVVSRLVSVRSVGGGTGLVNVQLDATGHVVIGSDPAAGNVGTSTAPLAINTWYRIEMGLSNGTSTNGTATARVYSGETNTVIASVDVSGANLGTSTMGTVRFGRNLGVGNTWTFDFDDIAFQTGSAALIGPSIVNLPPTANAGPDQTNVEPWSTVTLTGTDSDTDGTIASRAWTKGGVTLATTATTTVEATATIAGITETYAYTVTDNAGATATDTMTVAVLPVTERAVIGGVEVPMRIRTT